MGARVDDVPAWRRPFWWAGSWVLALATRASMRLQHATCRIRVHGDAALLDAPGHILAHWHENVWSMFVLLQGRGSNMVWMQHPAAYMKPVHLVVGLMGGDIVLGSQGDEGRRAADIVATRVHAGARTTIAPDGPGGPVRVLKKGVLHMALKSGAPIVPIAFGHHGAWRARTWDRKFIARPFSRIDITVGPPIRVADEAAFEAAGAALAAALSEPS